MKNLVWILGVVLCLLVGAYPLVYLFAEGKIGLLQIKPEPLLANTAWRLGFYLHIVGGGVALLVGWTQFVKSWRTHHLNLHRNLGKLYLVMVGVSGVAGVGIAPWSSTGWVAGLGFGALGVFWLLTTLRAYQSIRRRDLRRHESLMIYSYSACLAAVTLRLWLPLLLVAFRLNFSLAYPIAAWLCWLPNLLVARWIVTRTRQTL